LYPKNLHYTSINIPLPLNWSTAKEICQQHAQKHFPRERHRQGPTQQTRTRFEANRPQENLTRGQSTHSRQHGRCRDKRRAAFAKQNAQTLARLPCGRFEEPNELVRSGCLFGPVDQHSSKGSLPPFHWSLQRNFVRLCDTHNFPVTCGRSRQNADGPVLQLHQSESCCFHQVCHSNDHNKWSSQLQWSHCWRPSALSVTKKSLSFRGWRAWLYFTQSIRHSIQ